MADGINGVALRNPHLLPGMAGIQIGQRDKDNGVQWVSPNKGDYLVHHVDQFLNRYTSLACVYRDYDEALLDSRDNARFMRNDVGIRECLDSRQRSVALLNWHIEPEVPKKAQPSHLEFCSLLETICRRIPHFTEYRRCCQHAIWYGKYGIQHRWGPIIVDNKSVYSIKPRHQDDWGWLPINGDKLVFRQLRPDRPMTPGSYEGQLGIRVGYTHKAGEFVGEGNRWRVEPTDYGLAYFLSPAERRLMLVHKHQIEDAAYEDGLRAGGRYGIGVRSVIYWEWIQKQATMGHLVEFIGRMAGGVQLWKYPQGNLQAMNDMKKAAENYNASEEHILLVPVAADGSGGNQYGIETAEPGFSGIEVLHDLITRYYEHRVKRYILGQILTSEAEATGLGSGVAELHADTLLQILQSDANAHEETLTSDLLESLIKVNVQKGVWEDPGFRPRFVCETEESDVDAKIQAWGAFLGFGLPIRKKDCYELIGAAMPAPGDDVLQVGQQAGPGAEGSPIAGGGNPLDFANDENQGAAGEVPADDKQGAKEETENGVHRYSRDYREELGPFRKSAFLKGMNAGIGSVRRTEGK